MGNKFIGAGVAIVTPMKSEGSKIDFVGLRNVIEHVISNGIQYIVVLGSTGEAATLTFDEQKAILETSVDAIQARVPLVLGLSDNSTPRLLSNLSKINLAGVDAILSATPHYNKPSQEGIFQHFLALAEESPLPIILYNVPGRTASNIEAKTVIKLAKAKDNIIGIKEASGNLAQQMEIRLGLAADDFLLLSGDDPQALPLLAIGGQGLISVIANAYPAQVSRMVNLCLDNDFQQAQFLHYQLLEIIGLIFADGNPQGIKFLLQHLGICSDTLRLPLTKINLRIQEHIVKFCNSNKLKGEIENLKSPIL